MIPITKTEDKHNCGYDRDLFESRHLKEEALANHEARRGDLLLQVRHIFIRHLLEHGQVTADDIRSKFEIPKGVNANFLGSVPTPFTRGLIIKRNGYVESVRREAHARVVSLWRLINREKAEQWLLNNPLPETSAASGEVSE